MTSCGWFIVDATLTASNMSHVWKGTGPFITDTGMEAVILVSHRREREGFPLCSTAGEPAHELRSWIETIPAGCVSRGFSGKHPQSTWTLIRVD